VNPFIEASAAEAARETASPGQAYSTERASVVMLPRPDRISQNPGPYTIPSGVR